MALLAGLLLGMAGVASALDEPLRPRAGPPMTTLAAGTLSRCTHVALGRVERLRDLRGQALAHVQVERWLGASAGAAEITVIVTGPRTGSVSRAVPIQPWFEGASEAAYVFFLWRRPGGEAFELVNRQVLDGLEGIERLRMLDAEVALASIADPVERAQRTCEHLLAALEGRGTWSRAYAARELATLLGAWPSAVGPSARARIERASSKATAPALRTALAALLRAIEALPPLPQGGAAQAPPAPWQAPAPEPGAGGMEEAGAADDPPDVVLARLDAVLEAAGPDAPARAALMLRRLAPAAQRQAVVDWLAAAGHVAALPWLREHYVREEAFEVRAAIVRAHGLLGAAADVPWLAERLGNARLREVALVALARLRLPAARQVLEAYAQAWRAGSEEEQALAAKVDLLLDPAFEAGSVDGGGLR